MGFRAAEDLLKIRKRETLEREKNAFSVGSYSLGFALKFYLLDFGTHRCTFCTLLYSPYISEVIDHRLLSWM